MKTFKDLTFEPHPVWKGGLQARMDFPNGFGISVITGAPGMYCNSGTYEVAVLKNGICCYSTPLTDNVLGYQTKEEVSKVMEAIQGFTKNQYPNRKEE